MAPLFLCGCVLEKVASGRSSFAKRESECGKTRVDRSSLDTLRYEPPCTSDARRPDTRRSDWSLRRIWVTAHSPVGAAAARATELRAQRARSLASAGAWRRDRGPYVKVNRCAAGDIAHFSVASAAFAAPSSTLRKGQLNRHTRYLLVPATTTRNTATQWSRRSVAFSSHKVPTSHYLTPTAVGRE